MKQELITILNILAQIETKGDGTMRMAMCMNMLNEAIKGCDSKQDKNEETDAKKVTRKG